MIDDMYDSGYGRLAQADAMMRDAQTELDLAAEALNKGHLSEAERNQLTSGNTGCEGTGASTYRSQSA